MGEKREKVGFGGRDMEGGIDRRAVRRTVEGSGSVTWDMTRILGKGWGIRGKWLRRKSRKAGGAIGAEGGVVEDEGERRERWSEVFAYGDVFNRSHLHVQASE